MPQTLIIWGKHKQNNKMGYGIKNLHKVSPNDEICQCTKCGHYYYDEITDERNENSLTFLYNEIEPYKGCPVCETDEHLIDIDITTIVVKKTIGTVQGEFDFLIKKIQFSDDVIIESKCFECFDNRFIFKPDYIYYNNKLIDKFVTVYNSMGIHLFDWDDENFLFDFTNADTIDEEKFTEIIDYILTNFI